MSINYYFGFLILYDIYFIRLCSLILFFIWLFFVVHILLLHAYAKKDEFVSMCKNLFEIHIHHMCEYIFLSFYFWRVQSAFQWTIAFELKNTRKPDVEFFCVCVCVLVIEPLKFDIITIWLFFYCKNLMMISFASCCILFFYSNQLIIREHDKSICSGATKCIICVAGGHTTWNMADMKLWWLLKGSINKHTWNSLLSSLVFFFVLFISTIEMAPINCTPTNINMTYI